MSEIKFIRTWSIPAVSVLTKMEQEIIQAHVERQIKELEVMAYCSIAGISEEEYWIRRKYPQLLAPKEMSVIDIEFEENKDE